MLEIRKSTDRGHAHHGWLDSHHTFSFAGYYDAKHMGFGSLRVINEDRVAPGMGFDPHSHRDMEILSYVIEGAIEHKDSMGNGSVIRPGELQLMRAGTGVTHSEFNPSRSEPVHFLQIWILPDEEGLEPAYDQRAFPAEERRDQLRLIASRDGGDGSLRVHQDLSLFATLLTEGRSIRHALPSKTRAWVQVIAGGVSVNGVSLSAGDGLAVSGESELEFVATSDCEALLFELR